MRCLNALHYVSIVFGYTGLCPRRFEEGGAYSFAAVRLSVGRSVGTPTVYLYFFAEVTYIKIKFGVQINPNDI